MIRYAVKSEGKYNHVEIWDGMGDLDCATLYETIEEAEKGLSKPYQIVKIEIKEIGVVK